MTPVLEAAALLVATGGILLAFTTAVTHGIQKAIPVLLDFFLAAGLLGLAAEPGWDRVLTTAIIAALRHLITAGLRLHPRRQRKPSDERSMSA